MAWLHIAVPGRIDVAMSMHESAVNYERLIRDLADMYPFDVSEVVFVELIANALDARADYISITYDPNGC
jgi:hypothetical protein